VNRDDRAKHMLQEESRGGKREHQGSSVLILSPTSQKNDPSTGEGGKQQRYFSGKYLLFLNEKKLEGRIRGRSKKEDSKLSKLKRVLNWRQDLPDFPSFKGCFHEKNHETKELNMTERERQEGKECRLLIIDSSILSSLLEIKPPQTKLGKDCNKVSE